MKIKITSLGCRLNLSEIESVSTRLQDMGHEIVKNNIADVYIINACAVTSRSEKKVHSLIAKTRKDFCSTNNRKIIVTGCSPCDFSDSPDVIYVSNDYKYLIPEIIENNLSLPEISSKPASRFSYAAPVKSSTVRANLKIQDGCDNFCTYCIIPYLRGKPVSRPSNEILLEFDELLKNGYKEIVLTGVNIGKYNYNETELAGLIEKILANHNSDFRLHLTSIDPDSTCDRLIGLYKDPRMVKHLHLSLQSGSDSVLKRMNRPYTRDNYIRVTEKIKNTVENFNFTTDVITGFPGETEDEFKDTISLAREVGFSHIHTFRYSPREGTRAYYMSSLIDEKIKKERSRIINRLSMDMKTQYYRKFNNRRTVLLTERFKNNCTKGFNNYYIPMEIEMNLPPNRFYEVESQYNEKKHNLSGTVRTEENLNKNA